ncbi:MAG: tetratricopeptide repeat protein [Planctomycetota bacterium]
MNQPTAPVRKKPKTVITARLRRVLFVVLSLFSILLANGLYLTSITWLQFFTGDTYENHLYQLMFLGHLGLGLLLIVPLLVFAIAHWWRAKDRRNQRAVKIGYGLTLVAAVLLVTGILLSRVGPFQSISGNTRSVAYWLHLIMPLVAGWLYWLHRLVGPRIKWQIGRRVALVTTGFVAIMIAMQTTDARISQDRAPVDGDAYFRPSLAKTATGKFISARSLQNDDYCLSCHSEIHASWLHSAHKLSSFNNPAYRASVRETRTVSAKRSGTVQASRFCAGCHDPVPFFSGQFDDPNYDDVDNPTAHAGITCTVCHAMVSIDSQRGNADYTIDEPLHYPFAYSENAMLRRLNGLMVKAKPAFHKQQMLKPFHRSAEFCSTCHKVHLPGELTDYKEFLRGQNHYDSYLLSGVSGHGARSFYYPPKAQSDCNTCHMPAMASDGFGSKFNDDLGTQAVHSHLFPSANTAIATWYDDEAAVDMHRQYLRDTLRIDLFGIRRPGTIDGELHAPLDQAIRERSFGLEPGETVLLETVLRTLTLGHHFTQGTTDSNQVWIEVTVRVGEAFELKSGHRDDRERVDTNAHFVNTFLLDRKGQRINRRNAQDIFTPLYSHQIPPGAGQTMHYRLQVPGEEAFTDVSDGMGELHITARLLYRKFDTEYLDFIRADRDPNRDPLDLGQVGDPNDLPIAEIDRDSITLPVLLRRATGRDAMASKQPSRDGETGVTATSFPTWQRWNDYGIGLLLKGKGELRGAVEAFDEVEKLGRYDGPLNLARVFSLEGDLDAATEALQRASRMEPAPPPWTFSWLSGVIDRQQGNLERAAESLRGVLETRVPDRGFDFSLDYVVRNELGLTLIDLAQEAELAEGDEAARSWLRQAETEFQTVLKLDPENVTAHANLAEVYAWLGNADQEAHHRAWHERVRPDENAREVAVPPARKRYPAADRAAEAVTIYPLFETGSDPS